MIFKHERTAVWKELRAALITFGSKEINAEIACGILTEHRDTD